MKKVRELPKLGGNYPNRPKWFRRPCQVSTFFWHDQAQARFVLQIQGVSIYSFLPAPLQGPTIEQRCIKEYFPSSILETTLLSQIFPNFKYLLPFFFGKLQCLSHIGQT